MSDNVDLPAATGKAATDEVSFSGDTAQVQLFRRVGVTGAEGSKSILALVDKLSGADTFTGVAAGTTRDCSAQGMSRFALQAKQAGTVTAWTIDLQVSLDGVNWVTLISHTKAGDGDGAIVSTGANAYPALYFRANCSALTLGGGTNVVVTVVGLP